MVNKAAAAGIAARVGAAVLGGYGFTYTVTALLALVLPMQRADAVLISGMASFAVYAIAVVWCFTARSAWRVWLGLSSVVPFYLFILLFVPQVS